MNANVVTLSETSTSIASHVSGDLALNALAPGGSANTEAEHASAMIEEIENASVGEIDQLMSEMGKARDFLRAESQRVKAEVQAYIDTSQSTLSCAKSITASLRHWRSPSPSNARD